MRLSDCCTAALRCLVFTLDFLVFEDISAACLLPVDLDLFALLVVGRLYYSLLIWVELHYIITLVHFSGVFRRFFCCSRQPMNDDYGSIQFQCPVVKPVANLNDAWTGTLLCMVLTLALALLLVSYKSYKMAKQAIEGCKRMQTQVDQLHELVNILRRANNELEGNHEMLSDEVADMLRAQRLRQAGESEVPAIPAGDPVVVVLPAAAPVPLSNLGQVHEMLSNEIDASVRREAFSQAEQFREAVTFILDSMNRAQPLARSTRIHLFQRLGDCLERLADQNRVLGEHTVGEQYQRFADRLRDLAFVD